MWNPYITAIECVDLSLIYFHTVNTESCNTPTPSSTPSEPPTEMPYNTTETPSVPSTPSEPQSTTETPYNTTDELSNTTEISSNTTGIPSVPSKATDSYITSSLDQMSDSPTTIDSNSTDLASELFSA